MNMAFDDPTPSELLSRDLVSLGLASNNRTLTAMTPSSRLMDSRTAKPTSTLPFERLALLSSSSYSSSSVARSNNINNGGQTKSPSPRTTTITTRNNSALESVQRYPTRANNHINHHVLENPTPGHQHEQQQHLVTPPGNRTLRTPTKPGHSYFSSKNSLPPLLSPPRSHGKSRVIDDIDNNPFMTTASPNNSPRILAKRPRPLSTLMDDPFQDHPQERQYHRKQSLTSSRDEEQDMTPLDEEEDDPFEIASTQSSSSSADTEKENLTPKYSNDPTAAAGTSCTGSSSSSHPKPDAISTTSSALPPPPQPPQPPTCMAGAITRSRRVTLGAISPWRWNTFGPDPSLLLSKKGLAGSSSYKKSGTVIGTLGCRPEQQSLVGSSGTATTSNDNTTMGSQEEHANKNSTDAAVIKRLTETEIQPHQIAFNRRAQQVAGQIYYWKQGGLHLIDEDERQNWPGEWKFEVFKDPESPKDSSSSSSLASRTATASATSKGKGKMVDRSGPAAKRARIYRESLGNAQQESSTTLVTSSHNTLSSSSDVLGTRRRPLATKQTDEEMTEFVATSTTPSNATAPSTAATVPRSSSTAHQSVQQRERYEFRERRILDYPLTRRRRQCRA
ncbi:hypothetical protein BGZ83_004536 [Gryganskiella cystojenkinii]|nr:hypothetical protein BGZ83_004536 [Gryganskiella cystojenkinii]